MIFAAGLLHTRFKTFHLIFFSQTCLHIHRLKLAHFRCISFGSKCIPCSLIWSIVCNNAITWNGMILNRFIWSKSSLEPCHLIQLPIQSMYISHRHGAEISNWIQTFLHNDFIVFGECERQIHHIWNLIFFAFFCVLATILKIQIFAVLFRI